MRLFTVRALGTILRLLVIFQLATVTALASDIQIQSEVNGKRLQYPRTEDAVDLYGQQVLATAPLNPWIKPFLPTTSAQPPNSPIAVLQRYSEPQSPEWSTNSLYHSNNVEFLPFSPALTPRFPPAFQPQAVQQTYQHPFQIVQPQFQQQFQNLLRPYFHPQQQPWNGYGWQQSPYSPWQQGQYQQQTRWQTQYVPHHQYHTGQIYPQPVTTWPLGQHQAHQKSCAQHPAPIQYPQFYQQNPGSVQYFEDFDRQYSNPEMSNLNAQDLMGKLDKLIEALKPIERPLPEDLKFQLFQQAARLLSRIASLSVVLISQRNNSEKDKRVDDFLHNMEDKSYQLKTMLIEMGSLSSDNIAVATPPKILPYQPPPIPPMWSPGGTFKWSIRRDVDHNMVNPAGSLDNLDR